MQELIYNQYKKLHVQGASKKTWYTFYRKLCVYHNIDRRLQLGLRGVPIEDIMDKCKELVDATGSICIKPPYTVPTKPLEEKKEEIKPPAPSNLSSLNKSISDESIVEIPPTNNTKVMITFSILVDTNMLSEVLNLINGLTHSPQKVEVVQSNSDPFSRK